MLHNKGKTSLASCFHNIHHQTNFSHITQDNTYIQVDKMFLAWLPQALEPYKKLTVVVIVVADLFRRQVVLFA